MHYTYHFSHSTAVVGCQVPYVVGGNNSRGVTIAAWATAAEMAAAIGDDHVNTSGLLFYERFDLQIHSCMYVIRLPSK